MKPADDVKLLLQRYIALHNKAVHGDAATAETLLADDVTIDVEGPLLSDLRKQAIVRSFRENEVVLWKVGSVGEDVAFANYAWREHPRIGGLIRVQRHPSGRIGRLTLRPGYSRIFGLIANPSQDGGVFAEPGGEDAFAPSTELAPSS